MNFVKVAILALEDAKRLEKDLNSKGINCKLAHNEQTCTRGCSVTVELQVEERDLQKWVTFQEGQVKNNIESADYDESLLEAQFDPSAEEATCPACGFKFPTSSSECPDCGLCI
jgi:hypothetical protein